MANVNRKKVIDYVETSGKFKSTVISARIKKKYDDLDDEVRVWDIKTKDDESYWVIEGENTPMFLYTQSALFLSADEAYSFHIGLMLRMKARDSNGLEYTPKGYINAATLGVAIFPRLLRKLSIIAKLVEEAEEIEDFKSIGMQCREILIDLGNHVYSEHMSKGEEQPKGSDFKSKANYFISYYYDGADNSEYRSILKKITESVWELSNKITHSNTTTMYEASICVSLCLSLVCTYECVMEKVYNPLSQYVCNVCSSKKLSIIDDETDDDGYVKKLILKCEECDETTNIVFPTRDEGDHSYIKGKME